MIFATVGSQMPFDRMIKALDLWVGAGPLDVNVLAQIGDSSFLPQNIKYVRSLTPIEFRSAVENSEVVVAHAGMGSVLTALEYGKKLVVMPRRGAQRETRNDHQIATAMWLNSKPGVFVALDETVLGAVIEKAISEKSASNRISAVASEELICAVRDFLMT